MSSSPKHSSCSVTFEQNRGSILLTKQPDNEANSAIDLGPRKGQSSLPIRSPKPANSKDEVSLGNMEI
jgi:hypothetical protein